jgi:hypothetical protein
MTAVVIAGEMIRRQWPMESLFQAAAVPAAISVLAILR